MLTDEEKARVAASRNAAVSRRAATIQKWIAEKREAAKQRKLDKAEALATLLASKRNEAKRRKLEKAARALIPSCFDDPDAGVVFDDPPPYDHLPGTPPEQELPPEDGQYQTAPPGENDSKQRQRSLTNKQKHNAASAHMRKIKSVINDESKKRGAASGAQHPVARTDNGIAITGKQRDPRTNTATTAHLETFPNIHQSHSKMMIRNIVF